MSNNTQQLYRLARATKQNLPTDINEEIFVILKSKGGHEYKHMQQVSDLIESLVAFPESLYFIYEPVHDLISDADIEAEAEKLYPTVKYETSMGSRLINEENRALQKGYIAGYRACQIERARTLGHNIKEQLLDALDAFEYDYSFKGKVISTETVHRLRVVCTILKYASLAQETKPVESAEVTAKDRVLQVIKDRIDHFYSIPYHSGAAKELEQGLHIVDTNVPPEDFEKQFQPQQQVDNGKR